MREECGEKVDDALRGHGKGQQVAPPGVPLGGTTR
jgi:hypothetical protein